jgi:kynureninase
MTLPATRADAEALDRADPFAAAAAMFALPHGRIYLDGHSLGPATWEAMARVEKATRAEWAMGLITSWNTAGWIDLPRLVGGKLARLVGADADEVVVADSVSVNLFKLAAAGLGLARSRVLVVEEDEFPTDQYVAEGLAGLAGVELQRVGAGAGAAMLRVTGGVMIRSVVNYRTAAIVDMAAAECDARAGGGLVVWDLSHATGVLDVRLHAAGARMAAGCTYKYLNGGPGAPAFVYVRRDIKAASPITGWMGHEAPFDFVAGYRPRADAARFAAGTPAILSLSALDGALQAFEGRDVGQLWAKAQRMGDLVIARGAALGLQTISPGIGEARGGHVSLLHADGYAIVQALIARGVIADFRAPDAMRFGLAPLYVRWVDVWDAMAHLGEVLERREYERAEFRARAAVT